MNRAIIILLNFFSSQLPTANCYCQLSSVFNGSGHRLCQPKSQFIGTTAGLRAQGKRVILFANCFVSRSFSEGWPTATANFLRSLMAQGTGFASQSPNLSGRRLGSELRAQGTE